MQLNKTHAEKVLIGLKSMHHEHKAVKCVLLLWLLKRKREKIKEKTATIYTPKFSKYGRRECVAYRVYLFIFLFKGKVRNV